MKYFVILLIFVISFLVSIYGDVVYGVPQFNPQSAFDYSKYVIIGKILSVEILSESEKDPSVPNGFALYEIEVEEYLKNPIGNSTITVPGVYVDSSSSRSYDVPLYEVGQRVLLHIQEEKHALVDYDLIIRDRASGVLLGPLCGPDAYFEKGVCVVADDKTIFTYLPCIESRGEECGDIEQFISTELYPCGAGTELVNGICQIIITEDTRHGPVPPFIDALFFMPIMLPFFIPSAIIFVVLSKTPRYSKEIRLSVCIPAIIMILYFLSGLYLGWYPPGYA